MRNGWTWARAAKAFEEGYQETHKPGKESKGHKLTITVYISESGVISVNGEPLSHGVADMFADLNVLGQMLIERTHARWDGWTEKRS